MKMLSVTEARIASRSEFCCWRKPGLLPGVGVS